jgi:hypothetical protein
MSATLLIGILVMMAAVVVGLVIWLILAFRAARRPHYERYHLRYQPSRRPAPGRDPEPGATRRSRSRRTNRA